MKVISCDDSHRAAWETFVTQSPTASFYHRFDWGRIYERCFGHRSAYLAAFEGDSIVGVFPIIRIRSRLFGNLACSLPFLNYGGPCAASAEAESALMTAARDVCDGWGVEYLEVRSRHYLGDALPVARHKVSMSLTLDRDPDKLWAAFKSGHRQSIRRGYKSGFTARFGGAELIDDFFLVLAESWRDLGTPIYRKSYLRSIAETFGNQTRLCVLYLDGAPAAAAFDGIEKDTVEGMWLGTRAKYRNDYAGYVLYWELVKHACESGLARFHLGRSAADSGGEAFKRKWNADLRPLYWHYVLRTRQSLPELNVQNPKYRLAINAWRRLPVPVTRIVGPLLARSIP